MSEFADPTLLKSLAEQVAQDMRTARIETARESRILNYYEELRAHDLVMQSLLLLTAPNDCIKNCLSGLAVCDYWRNKLED